MVNANPSSVTICNVGAHASNTPHNLVTILWLENLKGKHLDEIMDVTYRAEPILIPNDSLGDSAGIFVVFENDNVGLIFFFSDCTQNRRNCTSVMTDREVLPYDKYT